MVRADLATPADNSCPFGNPAIDKTGINLRVEICPALQQVDCSFTIYKALVDIDKTVGIAAEAVNFTGNQGNGLVDCLGRRTIDQQRIQ